MRPFGEHFGHDFAKIDAMFSRFGACGVQVAHRSPADVVSDTLSRIHSPQFTLVLIEKVALSLECAPKPCWTHFCLNVGSLPPSIMVLSS